MKIKTGVLLALAVLAVAFLPLPDFWITQLNYIGLYSLTGLGLVLLTGVAGLTSFGQAAFVGIGAYVTAWLTLNLGMSPWLTLFIGLAITALSALVVGGITLRMSGHYLPLATSINMDPIPKKEPGRLYAAETLKAFFAFNEAAPAKLNI